MLLVPDPHHPTNAPKRHAMLKNAPSQHPTKQIKRQKHTPLRHSIAVYSFPFLLHVPYSYLQLPDLLVQLVNIA